MTRKIVMDFIKRTSGTPRQIYIPFYLLDICGDSYDAAVLMNQILFWADDPHRRKDGWYAAPYEKIKKDLRLSKFRVMGAMKILSALGVETKSMISPRHKYTRVVHYRVNEEIFMKIIEEYLKTEDSTSWSEENEFHNDMWSEENEFHESEFVDAVNTKKKREIEKRVKEKDIAPASDDTSAHMPASLHTADGFDLDGDAAKPARGKKTKAKDVTATTPLPKGSAQKVSPAAQLANALNLTPVDSDWSKFGKVAGTLNTAGITCKEFVGYVFYWREMSKRTGNWDVTLMSLTGGVRVSEFCQWRSNHPDYPRWLEMITKRVTDERTPPQTDNSQDVDPERQEEIRAALDAHFKKMGVD